MSDDIKELSRRKLNFFQTVKAVLWGFFGVRKGAGYQEDIAKLNPVHLIIAGILAGVLFVVGLVLIVRWVVASSI
jgi:Protein of unknown function (DUF2970).